MNSTELTKSILRDNDEACRKAASEMPTGQFVEWFRMTYLDSGELGAFYGRTLVRNKYGKPSIGCYFDGLHGQTTNDLRVIKLALGYGWDDDEARAIHEAAPNLSEHQEEILTDCVADAETYLNDLETRPFMSWGWDDGNFGLWINVEGAKENCRFVSGGDDANPDDSSYPADDYRGEWLHVSDHGNPTLYVRGDDGKDVEIWSVV